MQVLSLRIHLGLGVVNLNLGFPIYSLYSKSKFRARIMNWIFLPAFITSRFSFDVRIPITRWSMFTLSTLGIRLWIQDSNYELGILILMCVEVCKLAIPTFGGFDLQVCDCDSKFIRPMLTAYSNLKSWVQAVSLQISFQTKDHHSMMRAVVQIQDSNPICSCQFWDGMFPIWIEETGGTFTCQRPSQEWQW